MSAHPEDTPARRVRFTCVGGLCDGQRVELDFEPTSNMAVRVEHLRPLGPALKGDDPIPLNEHRLDVHVQTYYPHYFEYADELGRVTRFRLLVPFGTGGLEILRRLLSRYPKGRGAAGEAKVRA